MFISCVQYLHFLQFAFEVNLNLNNSHHFVHISLQLIFRCKKKSDVFDLRFFDHRTNILLNEKLGVLKMFANQFVIKKLFR